MREKFLKGSGETSFKKFPQKKHYANNVYFQEVSPEKSRNHFNCSRSYGVVW